MSLEPAPEAVRVEDVATGQSFRLRLCGHLFSTNYAGRVHRSQFLCSRRGELTEICKFKYVLQKVEESFRNFVMMPSLLILLIMKKIGQLLNIIKIL